MATITYSANDPQQFSLYDAEAGLTDHRHNRHYRDGAEAKAFIKRVENSKEFKALGGKPGIKVVQTQHDSGIATCYAHKNQICLPGWAFNQKTILHEIAHLVTDDAHGPRFAGTALMLYRKFISTQFADEMERYYARENVKFVRRRFKYRPRS